MFRIKVSERAIDLITIFLFLITIAQGMSKHLMIPVVLTLGDELFMIVWGIWAILYCLRLRQLPTGWWIPLAPVVVVLISWLVNTDTQSVTSLAVSLRAYFTFVPAFWWGYVHYGSKVTQGNEKAILKRVAGIFGAVFLVQMPVILYQAWKMFFVDGYHPDVVYGLFGDANFAGYFLTFALIYYAIYFLESKKSALYLVVASLSFAGILLFEARAGVVLTLGILFIYILYKLFFQKEFKFYGIIALVIIAGFTALYSSYFNENVLSLLNPKFVAKAETTVKHGANRFLWMDKTWDQLTYDHPEKFFFGFGPGNHSSYYAISREAPIWKSELYNAFGQLEQGHDTGVDSQLVPVLGEFGFIGVAVFYGFILYFMVKSLRLGKIAKLSTSQLAGIGIILFWLLNSYTNHTWEMPALALMFYFLMGVSVRKREVPARDSNKILFFNHNFWPNHGGVEQQALRLAKGLRSKGFDVRVLTAKHQKGLSSYEIIEGVPVYRFWYPHFLPLKFLRKMTNMIAGFIALPLIAGKFNFKLLHIHQMQWLTMVGAFYQEYFGYKMIGKLTNSGHAADALEFYKTQAFLAPLFQAIKLRDRVYSKFDAIIAISRLMQKEMAQIGVSEQYVRYIPNGIHLDTALEQKVMRSKKNERIKIVTAIRFVQNKNPIRQLEAFKIFLTQHKELANDIEFTMFGEGPLLVEAREFVKAHNVENNVKLPGATPNEQVLQSFRESDILINVTEIEGLSNTILEGMVSGLALLISDVGGARDLIGAEIEGFKNRTWAKFSHGVLINKDSSPQDIAEAMFALVRDRNWMNDAGLRAKAHVKDNFEMSIVVEKYAKLYEELGLTRE